MSLSGLRESIRQGPAGRDRVEGEVGEREQKEGWNEEGVSLE